MNWWQYLKLWFITCSDFTYLLRGEKFKNSCHSPILHALAMVSVPATESYTGSGAEPGSGSGTCDRAWYWSRFRCRAWFRFGYLWQSLVLVPVTEPGTGPGTGGIAWYRSRWQSLVPVRVPVTEPGSGPGTGDRAWYWSRYRWQSLVPDCTGGTGTGLHWWFRCRNRIALVVPVPVPVPVPVRNSVSGAY